MKIERLDLRAYGPFTGAKLDFGDDEPGLHVVYGPNEAGKSSALRALAAGLFGIGVQTSDDFLHEYSALRIAMTLRAANGERLDFVRRKTKKGALRDASDAEALPDDALRPFLGRVDAEEFQRVFGLDHVRLRDGADRLLDASEGADSLIAGAALGVNDLRSVREALENQAGELFKAAGSKPRINDAVRQWKDLQAEMRRRSMTASAWDDARRTAERLAKERDAASTAERELRARQRELDLVKRNRPRVTRLHDLRARLEEQSTAPDLAESFESRCREAEDLRREAAVRLDQLRRDLEERHESLRALPSDFSLLDHVVTIDELRTMSIEVTKAQLDRERLRARCDENAKERDRLARDLGLQTPLSAASLGDLRLSLGARERCNALVQQHTRLTTERAVAAANLADLERKLARCVERLADGRAAVDSTALANALRLAQRQGEIDAELANQHAARKTAAAELDAGVQRLLGSRAGAVDADAMAARPVPGPAAIEEFSRRFREIEDEERQARAAAADRLAQRGEIEATLDRIAAGGAVPSEQDLGSARAGRDAVWRLVRRAWLERADVTAEARAIDPDHALPETFERSVERADELADRLRRESERVAQQDVRRRQIAAFDRAGEASDEAARDRQVRRERLAAEWRAAWEPSGFEVRDPAAMKDALAERQRLLEARERLRAIEVEIDGLSKRRADTRATLMAALADAGPAPPATIPADALAPLLLLAEERSRELGETARKRRDDEQEGKRLRDEIAKSKGGIETIERELGAWRESFAAATRGIPLRDGEPPDAVPRVLDRIAAIAKHGEDIAGLEQRIERIDADSAELERRIREFRAADVAARPTEDPVAFLGRVGALVESKRREKQEFVSLSAQIEKLEARRSSAAEDHERSSRTLSDLAKEAGATTVDELPELVRRANVKRDVRTKLAETEAMLRGESLPIDEIERRVAALEGRDVEAELDGGEVELEAAKADADRKREVAAESRRELEALERESGAADLATEMSGLAARIREDAETYARLVLAGKLLDAAIDRYRQRNETPLLRHASLRFAGLTQGRYDRVETDVDDDGKAFFLVRESASGSMKRIDALSDGTRDQLHLALVLGSLQHRFESGADPMPLVLDDVLVHFDDDRSLAALEVLADFSRTTQVILFTHHSRIREQAATLAQSRPVRVHHLAR